MNPPSEHREPDPPGTTEADDDPRAPSDGERKGTAARLREAATRRGRAALPALSLLLPLDRDPPPRPRWWSTALSRGSWARGGRRVSEAATTAGTRGGRAADVAGRRLRAGLLVVGWWLRAALLVVGRWLSSAVPTTGRRLAPALPRVVRAALVAVLVATGTVVVGRMATMAVSGLPETYETGNPVSVELSGLAVRSTLYAADGSVIQHLHAGENRTPVALDAVPDHLVDAVLDTEDSDFLTHPGIDGSAVARAFTENVGSGEIVEGGSTITQQLAKEELDNSDRDLPAKLKEARMALDIERHYDKPAILEHYLNAVYLGNGAYGVGAAAELYFGKHVGELDVGESALLAGLIAAPRRYDPYERPDVARARRAVVLQRMVAAGHLDPAEAEEMEGAPLPTERHVAESAPEERYFMAEVVRRLLRDPTLGDSREERYRKIFTGGLQIHTTLDRPLQQLAVRTVAEQLPESPFTAALATVNPTTGEVPAFVGGPSFDDAKFNLATQGARQPGSAFKVFTLVAALESGYSPEDMVDGHAPCELPQQHTSEPWRVLNYDGPGGGVGTMREALVRSLNCAFARIVIGLGPERVVNAAHRLGIDRHLNPYPSITLGAEVVSPLDMATAFATLAADGVRRGPVLVRRIEDQAGNVIVDHTGREERAVEPRIARMATDIMRGVVERGTGRAADIGRPVAGKTGTAQEWRDAWFAGFTPQLATAVWMGSPEGEIPMRNVGGTRVTGGSFPARIWAAFMGAAHAGQPVVNFPPADPASFPDPGWIDETGRHDEPPPEYRPDPEPKKKPEPDREEGGNGPPSNGGPPGLRDRDDD